jgi:protein SCO1/2
MGRKLLFYGIFFVVLITGFLFFVFKDEDMSKSLLPVINANIGDFSFTNQNGKIFSERNVDGKVYVAEYFFTTCKGICPKMNANMRRVYDVYKDEPNFLIISHSCMPETDSVPLLKAYEEKMINGKLVKKEDGSYKIEYDTTTNYKPQTTNLNWNFVTGDKTALYKMARQGYMIDNNKPDSAQKMADQFIHTQFFALVDNQRRLRGIYDGLKEDEIQKLLKDIKGLLKEKVTSSHFVNGFSNNPN